MNTISMTVTMTKATLKPRLQLRQVNASSSLSERFIGKLLCGLLLLSAIAGTAWGCLNLLERVQNGPVLSAWVGRILGA